MISKFLNTQTKSVSLASFILAVSYIASAVLGFVRDHFLAGIIGTTHLDVYYAAFTIPDFIALMLIFGAISAAIVPMFSERLAHSKEEAFDYANNLLNMFLACLIIVCFLAIVIAPWLAKLVAPGFSLEKQAQTAMLMRIMFLSPIILGTSSIFSGMLQVFHRFVATALAPIMYNLGIIAGIFFLVPLFGLSGLAMGVVLGGLLHLCIQLPSLWHEGFSYKFLFNVRHGGVWTTLKLTIPRSLGLGAGQINTMVTTAVASTLSAGSVAVFNLANNLSAAAVSMAAVSLSTAIFPSLSRLWILDRKEFSRKFSAAFLQFCFLAIPAGLLLFVLRAQVTRVVLGSGRFTWNDTRLTAACLGLLALSLCFQGLVLLLSKTFYAAHNTVIPATISIVTVVLNIALSLLMVTWTKDGGWLYVPLQDWLRLQGIGNIAIVGLALAFSVTAMAESLLLLWVLQAKYRVFSGDRVWLSIVKMVAAGAVMLAVALSARDGLVHFHIIELQTTLGVLTQFLVAVLAGGGAYVLVAWLFSVSELSVLVQIGRRLAGGK